MSTNLRIVEKLIYSLDDEIEFKRIKFDVQKIKNQILILISQELLLK